MEEEVLFFATHVEKLLNMDSPKKIKSTFAVINAENQQKTTLENDPFGHIE
jgi:hypothetical protein